MKRLRLLLVVMIGSTLNAFPQVEVPRLSAVAVSTIVSSDSHSGGFSYGYTVSNANQSTGSIIRIEIDIHRDSTTVGLDTLGLTFSSAFVEDYFREMYPPLQGKIVPVGFPVSPSIWFGSLANSLTAVFHGDYRRLIRPGEHLDSLVLTSKGLPAIRRFKASVWFDVDSLFASLSDSALEAITARERDSLLALGRYSGWTLGPIGPPSHFEPRVFLDSLGSLVGRSYSLGWISDGGTRDKYSAYFATSRSQLQAGNIKDARTTLATVLHDVSVDSASTLSSEAYALIHFNTEYLLSKLTPSRDVKGGLYLSPSTAPLLSVRANRTQTLLRLVRDQ